MLKFLRPNTDRHLAVFYQPNCNVVIPVFVNKAGHLDANICLDCFKELHPIADAVVKRTARPGTLHFSITPNLRVTPMIRNVIEYGAKIISDNLADYYGSLAKVR